MITRQRKTKKDFYENFFFSVLIIVLIFSIVGFLIVSDISAGKKRGELEAKIKALKGEIQSLQAKKNELTGQVGASQNQELLEREARERFNLKKPGEEVVNIIPLEGGKESGGGAEQNKKPWWTILSF